MMRSLFSAVSGLKAHQQEMDVIGNNIANVNTTGYKKSRATFADMLSQTLKKASLSSGGGLGGTNPVQIGSGVAIASIDTDFNTGNLQSTDNSTDLGIDGDGFFVLKDGNQAYYTRAGDFNFDSAGNLVSLLNGMYVQGWMATDGVIDQTKAISNIQIPSEGVTAEAKATTSITFTGNLNSEETGTLTFKDGTNAASFSVTHTEDSTPYTGNLTLTLTPTSSYNTWNWAITAADDTAAVSGGSGVLTLGSDGKIASITGTPATVTYDPEVAEIQTITAGAPAQPAVAGVSQFEVTSNFAAGDTISVNGTTFTAIASGTPADGEFVAGATAAETAANLATAITAQSAATNVTAANTPGSATITLTQTAGHESATAPTATASGTGAVSTVTVTTPGATAVPAVQGVYTFDVTHQLVANSTVTIDGTVFTAVASGATGNQFNIGADAAETAANLATAITASGAANYTAASTSGSATITLTQTAGHESATPPGVTYAGTESTTTINLPGVGSNPFNFTASSPDTITSIGETTFTPASARQTAETVYDALGSAYTVTTTFNRVSDTEWTWQSAVTKTADSGDITISSNAGNGTIDFDSTGNVSMTTGTISFDPGNGTQLVTIKPDFSSLNQNASDSTASAESQNGYAAGELESYSFDTTGALVGVFSNGVTQILAQVALARFANSSGLERNGESNFSQTSNSGEAIIGSGGATGYGTIKPSSLEASNVDLATEFTDMIVTQRGYEANSKVITTSNQMLEDLINMIR